MAKVKIEGLITQLDEELSKALNSTLRKHFENDQYSAKEVFKTFKKELVEKCNSWEAIPNKYIKNG